MKRLLGLFMICMSVVGTARVSAQTACAVVGWASQNGGVTGGGTAAATVVSTYDALKAAITSSSVKVVHVSGTITIPAGGRISFQDQSGKTLYGLPGSRLVSKDLTKDGSGILYVKRCSNIIFRNLTFEGPGAYDTDGWDNMTLDNSTNIWVDHCEFQDGMDGNLDIKTASDYITVTWCKFTYKKAPIAGGSGGSDDHRFSNLFGSSDGATGDRGKLRVTLQHNWWAEGCKERMPRVRFGKVHMVNNLFNSTASNKCIMAGYEADLLVESNVFENVKSPIDLMDKTFTAITARNNIFTGTSGNTAGSGTAFTPPYTLVVTPAATVKSTVTGGAGATLTSPACGGSTTPTTYTLTTTAVPAAGGTVSNAGTYASGTSVTVTATPATGYTFVGWSGAASGTTTSVAITMNANKAVTATFQLQSTGGGGTGAVRIEDNSSAVCAYDGSISANTGASNGNVINLSNSAGKGVSWAVTAATAGSYTLTWRYVNSSSSNAYALALSVNGTVVNSAVAFAKTANSTTFGTATATVSLAAGSNTIRLETTTAKATADIDWLEVNGNAPAAGSCAGTLRESAVAETMVVEDVAAVRAVTLYPNPTTDEVVLTLGVKEGEQVAASVYDDKGKRVSEFTVVSAFEGQQKLVSSLRGQKAGVYSVVVVSGAGQKATYKVVVK